jgi:hypothetical protein
VSLLGGYLPADRLFPPPASLPAGGFCPQPCWVGSSTGSFMAKACPSGSRSYH